MNSVEFGEQHYALLFTGIGPCDHGDNRFGGAGVVGQMRNIGGNVKEASGFDDGVVLEAFSVPNARGTVECVDGRLMCAVLVCASTPPGGNGDQLHVD